MHHEEPSSSRQQTVSNPFPNWGIRKEPEKTANMSDRLHSRLYWISRGVDTLKHNFSDLQSETLHRKMMEMAILVKQMVEEILGKYKEFVRTL